MPCWRRCGAAERAGRQARVAALLGLTPERCAKVALDTDTAKRIGVRIGECGRPDVVI